MSKSLSPCILLYRLPSHDVHLDLSIPQSAAWPGGPSMLLTLCLTSFSVQKLDVSQYPLNSVRA